MPEDMEEGRSLIVCLAPGIGDGVGTALEAGAGMGGAVRGAREIFTVCAFSTSASPAAEALASASLMVCEAPPAADWGVSLMVAAEADV